MAGRNAYEVIVKILADASKATTEFQKAEKSAERMAKKTSDSMKLAKIDTERMAKQATIAGGVMIAAGTTMALGLSRTVKSAQEAEAAQLRLRNTIQGSANLGPRAMAAFEGQAKAIQSMTVASDEAVMGVQSMLGQMGMTQRQVLQLTPLVVDLSRKMGVDFNSAAKAVGKAVDGNTAGLKRMGVVVDATKAKVDPFTATVEALRAAAGGFAVQEGQTFAGQMAILNNQADELKESLGRGVLSVMTKLLPAVNTAAGAFVNLDDATGGTVGSIAALGTGLTIAGGAALAGVGQFQKLKETYDKLTESSKAFQAVTAATPYVLAAAAGVIIGQKLGEKLLGGQEMADRGYSQFFDATTARDKVKAFFVSAEGEARKGVTGLGNLLGIMGKATAGAVVAGPAGLLYGLSKGIDDAARNLSKSGIDKTMRKLLELDPEGARSVVRYIDTHDRLKQKLLDMGVPLEKYRKAVREQVDTNLDGKKSIEEKLAAMSREEKALQEYSATMLDAGNQSRQFANAQLDLARAQDGVKTAQQDYEDALKSGDPEKIRKAQLDLQGAFLQVAAAQDQVTAAAIKQAEAQLNLQRIAGDTKSYKAEIARLSELRDTLTDPAMVDAINRQIDSINLLRITAGKKIDLNDGELMASLWRLAAAGRVTDEQLRQLRNYGRLTMDTTQAVAALQTVTGAADMTRRQLMAVQVLTQGYGRGVLSVETQLRLAQRIAMTGETPDQALAALRGRAVGGPVQGRTPYLVGERGPELFVPNTAGNIVPNHQLGAGVIAAGPVINVHVASTPLATPAETGAAVVDALTAWQRRNGRLPLAVA
jgi:hypothetical protein